MSPLSEILARGAGVDLYEVALRRVVMVRDVSGAVRCTTALEMERSTNFVRCAWMVEVKDAAGRRDRVVKADYRAAREYAHETLRQCGDDRDPIPSSVEEWAWRVQDGKLLNPVGASIGA